MKILYSIQATGNGHISRAMELLPYLEQYGQVDCFLSGGNSSLSLDAPIKYRSRGLSLYYNCDGTLSYRKTVGKISPWRIFKEVRDLPVEQYDLVINDFECITALACAYKKVPSVQFGHQASFLSPHTPRPDNRNRTGEWILRNYARASRYLGLHFESYDDFILSPVVKAGIREAEPRNDGHITVYLPAYCDDQLAAALAPMADWRFEVFSFQVKEPQRRGHIQFVPVNRDQFTQSLIGCHGIITGGGFETPAEALFLRKKIMSIPIRGQYEQLCNAAALKRLGVPVLDQIDDDFTNQVTRWITDPHTPAAEYRHDTEMIVNTLMTQGMDMEFDLDVLYPELVFN